jgi:hypothetical protein
MVRSARFANCSRRERAPQALLFPAGLAQTIRRMAIVAARPRLAVD